VLVHRLPGGVEIPNLVDDVDVVSVAEDARDALASEIAVVCDEYAYRHRTPSRPVAACSAGSVLSRPPVVPLDAPPAVNDTPCRSVCTVVLTGTPDVYQPAFQPYEI
jgi:hypothetical protein